MPKPDSFVGKLFCLWRFSRQVQGTWAGILTFTLTVFLSPSTREGTRPLLIRGHWPQSLFGQLRI